MAKKEKSQVKESIEEFFESDVSGKSKAEIKKIKKAAMSINYKLGDKRKLFCQKCYKPYNNEDQVRILNGMKRVKCSSCENLRRWKIKD